MSSSPHFPKIVDAVRQIAGGRLTARELVEHCLANIQRFEPDLHAWVMVDAAEARAHAEMLDSIAARGKIVGPLHGVPLAIKDIIDVAPWPTKAGSPLRENHRATASAEVVLRLQGAGAILLGKTVTTQFASFDPSPTKNPWNLAHTPGGSSSGSAAAVAAEMCLAALGTQTGGSITRPATYCGVCGFKPTYGATSNTGVVPLAKSLDHVGAIAPSVSDLRVLWNVLRSDRNPKGETRTTNSTASGQTASPKIGVLREFFFDPHNVSAAVARETNRAIDTLRSGGATMVEVERLPVSFAQVIALHRRVMAVEAAEYHRDNFPVHRAQYGPNIASLMDEGLAATPGEYEQALAHRRQFQRDLLTELPPCEIWLTPATNTTAPRLETTGNPLFISPWSYCGWPTVSLPCGWDDSGLPCGLQLIARPGNDDALLDHAEWVEAVLNVPRRTPAGLCP